MSKKNNVSRFAMQNLKKSSVIEKLIKNSSGMSQKQKNKLLKDNLQLGDYKGKNLREVDIEKLNESLSYRTEEFDNTDFEAIQNADPLKVVAIKGLKEFFLIEGFELYNFLKKNGAPKINVEIVGEAQCLAQLYFARAKSMINFNKSISNLELSLGLLFLRDELIKQFGKKAFYDHGGKRKGKGKSKLSLSPYISKLLNMKTWSVAALLNFGLRLGPSALMGLQNFKEAKELSIRSIQQLNAPIKKAKLKSEIDKCLRDMADSNASEQDIIYQAGKIAFDFIQEKLGKNKAKLMSSEELINTIAAMFYDFTRGHSYPPVSQKDADAGEIKTGDDDSDSEESEDKVETPTIPPKCHEISRKDLTEIKKRYKDYFKMTRKVDTFLKSKRKLSESESQALYDMIDSIRSTFTDFAELAFKAIHGM